MSQSALIDSHVHVWDPDRLRYPWLEQVPQLRRRYDLGDFRAACGDVDVAKMVFVQADVARDDSIAEIAWVAELARDDPRMAAGVAWAPVDDGARVAAHLESLRQFPLVRGVRRLLQDEADVEICLHDDFVTGVRCLAEFDLTFDLCIRAPQLGCVTELVRRCPEVDFVLDHIGKPAIAQDRLDPWREDIRALAALDNVTCKISGVATEADHKHWTADALRPYIEHACETFGFDRVMFGGDWPVAILATSYPRWVETLDGILGGCSESERSELYRDNASRVYQL